MTQEELKSYLHYDPAIGVFTTYCRNKEIGFINSKGYKACLIKNHIYVLHRLAFLYMTGSIPEVVKHKNGDKTDNRFDNLYGVSKSSILEDYFSKNPPLSKVRYCNYDKKIDSYRVRFKIKGKLFNFGIFKDLDRAEEMAIAMRKKYFPQEFRMRDQNE